MSSTRSYPMDVTTQPVQPIHFWQHPRAVANTLAAYLPGTDTLVDEIRSASHPRRVTFQYLLAPLYFASEQGWTIRGEHGEMAAIMYLRRGSRQGIRVMHIDDISVGVPYRRLGLAQRLMEHAQELAIRESCPFLKLAVTVSNTPARTLYRRLGYQDQHFHYFTWTPSSTALRAATSSATNLTLRPLRQRQAEHMFRQLRQMELEASVPRLADMLAAYYSHGIGLISVPRTSAESFEVLQDGTQIGYGDVSRKDARWNLRLSLHPDWWGTDTERQVIVQLAGTIPQDQLATEIALYVPSAAHVDAISANPSVVAGEPDLVEQSFDRMIMVKPLA
jgi:GNAT superfamily N-acetyltransferase